MPEVSIVVAAFNCKNYIKKTIESALSQTFRDYELIIVDDCSTDGTIDIIRSFTDPRINVIRLDKNRGCSGARNEGMRYAKGDYIALLDHDDEWLPQKLEKQIRLFERDEDVGMVYSDCYIIDKSGSLTKKGKKRIFNYNKPARGYVFNKLLIANFIPTPSVMYKNSVVKEVGSFDSTYVVALDLDYHLRICKRCKADYVDEPLVKYRWGGGLTDTKKDVLLKETIEITKKHLMYMQNPSFLYMLLIGHGLMHCYKELGYFNMRNRNFETAKQNFLTAIKYYPLHPKPFLGLMHCVINGICEMGIWKRPKTK